MKTNISKYIEALESGGRPKGGASNDGDIPSLGAEHLNSDGTLNLSDLKYIPKEFYQGLYKGKIKRDDILIVKDGATTGKTSYVNGSFPFKDAAINEHVFLLRVDTKKVYPKYLFYHLYSDFGKNQILSDFRGSTVGGISRGFVDYVNLSLPDLKNQQEIAQVLEQADKARQQRKAANALTDHFLQSSFLSLFGDPVKNEKGWDVKKFLEVGSLDRGKSKHRPRNAPELLNGPYPLIQTGDIANCSGYIYEYNQTYSEIGLKQSKMWPKGTLCITIAANIAKTGILTFESCFPDSVVGFVANKKVNTEYVQYWISFLQEMLEANAPESAQKNINLEILRNLDIPVPPFVLQQQFAGIVAQTEQLRQKQRESERELENLFQGLLQKYFG